MSWIRDDLPEWDIVYKALGRALSAWAVVENCLGNCYSYCASDDADIRPAKTAYWNKRAFAGKLKMSAKAIAPAIVGWPDMQARWADLHQRLDDRSDDRNKLAHGSTYFDRGRFCIAPFFFQEGHAREVIADTEPLELLEVADIDAMRFGFIELFDDLVAFGDELSKRLAR